ncbi:Hypothetical predicted protein, partial [Mytilus galloprovincialis]
FCVLILTWLELIEIFDIIQVVFRMKVKFCSDYADETHIKLNWIHVLQNSFTSELHPL